MKNLFFWGMFLFVAQNASALPITPLPQQKQLTNTTSKTIKTPMVSEKYEVTVGTSLPLKGEAAIIAQDILDGMQLYFSKIKQHQPPLNFFVNLSALNDSSSIQLAKNNIKKLQQQSPILVSLFGTNTTKAAIPSLKKNETISMFPIEGSSEVRNHILNNQVFMRADHKSEIKALVKFIVDVLNKKKIAIFYEDSDWGNDALSSAVEILQRYNLKPEITANYQEKTVNISSAVKSICHHSPAAILCISQARPAYNFINQAINKGLHKTIYLGLSNLFWIQKTLKESRGVTVVLSSVVPSPFKSEFGIARQFREDIKKYLPNKPMSPFVFEGYLNASLLCAILQTTGFPLTLEKILKAVNELKKFKLKVNEKSNEDLYFKFDEKTRCLLKNQTWLNTGVNKKWKSGKDI